MAYRFRNIVHLLALAAVLSLSTGMAASQGRVDCSAAARRVIAQTGGQLLSANAVRRGSQTLCQVTVLTSDASGKRRAKKTVMTNP